MEKILEVLANHGLPGVIIGILVAAIWLKEKENKEQAKLFAAEKDARIADAKAYNELALKLQQEVIAAVSKVSMLFEELKEYREQLDKNALSRRYPNGR